MYIIGYPLLSIVDILSSILYIYSIIVLLACILSFVNADNNNQFVKIINNITYPLFVYVRKFIRPIGNIDLSPFIVILILVFIMNGILPIFRTFAEGLIK